MMNAQRKPLRLWPGVAIVVLQLIALYLPGRFAPSSPVFFFGMMGAMTVGPLLLLVWWLFFSRAAWRDRLVGLVLLVGVHALTLTLADPTGRLVAMMHGTVWLCVVFVASLFFRRRAVTIAAILVASLGWTLVRTDGVTGAMGSDISWRWGKTAEQRFLESSANTVPSVPAGDPDSAADAAAWSGFRGAARDGVVRGVELDSDWSQQPPQEIWRRQVGPGWGSFVLVGDRLCTQEQRDQEEVVVCYDAGTGEPIWLHSDGTRFWEAMGGAGPRATPTFHEGRLYTMGATGLLNCLDAATGRPIWTRNIAEDTGAAIPVWGFSSSPLVVGGLVIVHAPGAPDGQSVVAYDLASGEPRWFGDAGGESYSSPHLATIGGVPQVVMLTGVGAFGLDAGSGAALWRHEWPMDSGSRCVQPTILGDDGAMLVGTTFGMGTRKIRVSVDASGGWTVDEEWTSRGLKPYYNDSVVHRGVVFGFDGNILAALDLQSGERVWKGGRYGNGQMLLLPEHDLLMVISEKGELALVRATADRFEEIARIEVLDGKTWNHPIIADGVVYLRNAEEAAAYRLPA